MRHISIAILLNLFLLTYAQQKEVSLFFAGDAMQHLPQIEAAKTYGGYNYDSCFYLLKDKISAADIACVNFETTLGGQPYRGYPMFSAPDEFALALKDSGFDLFFLANNHILDSRQKGLERTIDVLDSMRIKNTGVFKSKDDRALSYPLMVIKNGIRIAFLNYTYGMNGLKPQHPNIVNQIDTMQIKRDIDMAKLYSPHIIIANMHWGDEYITSPNREQKALAQLLIDNGVRIVIGNHPHVVQPMVKNIVDNKISSVVYYSLGNFISNQQRDNTDGGAIAEITLRMIDDGSESIEIVSSSYSLAWVRRYEDDGKLKYVLIPTDDIDVTLNLSEEELVRLKRFADNANIGK